MKIPERLFIYNPAEKCENCGKDCLHYEPKGVDGCLNKEIREFKKIEEKIEWFFK
jgi:hypothetical protein